MASKVTGCGSVAGGSPLSVYKITQGRTIKHRDKTGEKVPAGVVPAPESRRGADAKKIGTGSPADW